MGSIEVLIVVVLQKPFRLLSHLPVMKFVELLPTIREKPPGDSRG